MSDSWIQAQSRQCTKAMRESISATHLRRVRQAFGQVVVPVRGSVVASPIPSDWNPNPDYFFHWLRDSALVMDAVTGLSAAAQTPETRLAWNLVFQDFVNFSLKISALDGSCHLGLLDPARVEQGYRQFLRTIEEMRALKGDLVLSDARVGPDGLPDRLTWSRAQYDGPALRALTCLRHHDVALQQGRYPSQNLSRLLYQDLDFTARHAGILCIGPWETEHGVDQHYYTAAVQLGAMHHGAVWAKGLGDHNRAARFDELADMLRFRLDGHWMPHHGFYKAALGQTATDPEELLDISVILGVNHARLPDGAHSFQDDRVLATLNRIEELFAKLYPLNHGRDAAAGLALGRYKTDCYPEALGGGPWYLTTLSAAELYYNRTAISTEPDSLIATGDAVLNVVKNTGIPADGSLSEKFDKVSGAQVSAPNLAWSSAAFLTAVFARDRALAATCHPEG